MPTTEYMILAEYTMGNISENVSSGCAPPPERVDEYKEFYAISQFVTGVILYPTICIPGLIGNILTLIVLFQPNMRNSTNAFLSALAVADSIKLLNDILYFSVLLLFRTNKSAASVAYGYIYPYAHFVFNMSACVSSWMTVSVAVERYMMVCHPQRARTFCTRRRAIITSVVIYVIMTLVAMPSAFRYKTITVFDQVTNQTCLDIQLTDLYGNKTFVVVYTWIQNFLRCNIPLFLLIVLNTCIVHSLRKTRARKKSSARQRITFMLVTVIVVFLICITPDAAMSTFLRFGYHEESMLVKGIREISDTLLALNAAVNFVIYCFFSSLFRRTFASLFCGFKMYDKIVRPIEDTFYRRLSDTANMLANSKRQNSRQNSTK